MSHPRTKLILASRSPRRRELLAQEGIDFEVLVPNDDAESGDVEGLSAQELVARFAWQKARDVASRVNAGLVVACDTVAECEGNILGKPRDEEDARRMLQQLAGRDQSVVSGLCLWPVGQGQPRVATAVTALHMRTLCSQELEEYLQSGLWRGKAGAFGLQDRLDWLTIRAGSESNVVGLPLELFRSMLAEWEAVGACTIPASGAAS